MSANGVWTRCQPSAERCRRLLEADAVETLDVRIEPRLAPANPALLEPFLPESRWFTLEHWEAGPDGNCHAIYRRRRDTGNSKDR